MVGSYRYLRCTSFVLTSFTITTVSRSCVRDPVVPIKSRPNDFLDFGTNTTTTERNRSKGVYIYIVTTIKIQPTQRTHVT